MPILALLGVGKPSGPSFIWDYDLESGDMTGLTQTGTDMAVTSGGLNGTNYKITVTVDDTTSNYVYGSILGTANTNPHWRVRFYLDPNSLTMGAGSVINIFALRNNSNQNIILVQLQFLSSAYKITAVLYNDAGTNSSTSAYTISDASHYVELDVTRGASSGTLTLFIDGAQQQQLTGVDNDTRMANVSYFLLGPFSKDASQSGTFFLDELLINDTGEAIGA